MNIEELKKTIRDIVKPGKGILAADESQPTIAKRFQAIGIESTENTRRDYRELLFTTPGINEFLSGDILFEETLNSRNKGGIPFPRVLSAQGIVPGIKVDKGIIALNSAPGDKITQGLDGLNERLIEYKQQGARFAKWRGVITISDHNPHRLAIKLNAASLARYASICQEQGIVPIVEPEILLNGNHTIQKCANVSLEVFHQLFHELHKQKVLFEYLILKPSMIISGSECPTQASVEEVAEATLKTLRETVPAAVPTINFLSGGQSDVDATEHLNAMNASKTIKPWNLSFSYARALQEECLRVWGGKAENIGLAQQALYKRAKLNSAATFGKYAKSMEK